MSNYLQNSALSIRSREYIWQAVDLFIPPFCCHCGRLGFEICPQCFSSIELVNQSAYCGICGQINHQEGICQSEGLFFERIYSFGFYTGALKSIIQKLKFHRGVGLSRYLVPSICGLIRRYLPDVDAVVSLPLGARRQLSRGYNQSAVFSKPVAHTLGIPFLPEAVKRIRETASQVGLSARERKLNIRDAFFAEERLAANRHFLLMDDITTTGSTINECAKALKSAGAASVSCFTLAKAKNLI
jgi:ComF family protein